MCAEENMFISPHTHCLHTLFSYTYPLSHTSFIMQALSTLQNSCFDKLLFLCDKSITRDLWKSYNHHWTSYRAIIIVYVHEHYKDEARMTILLLFYSLKTSLSIVNCEQTMRMFQNYNFEIWLFRPL